MAEYPGPTIDPLFAKNLRCFDYETNGTNQKHTMSCSAFVVLIATVREGDAVDTETHQIGDKYPTLPLLPARTYLDILALIKTIENTLSEPYLTLLRASCAYNKLTLSFLSHLYLQLQSLQLRIRV